jgi:hypothetical protein
MERAGGLEHLLEVFRASSVPAGLRSGSAIGRGDHLLPVVLLVLVFPIVVLLR